MDKQSFSQGRIEILQKEMKLAEELFGTEQDPEQMPITDKSVQKLDALYPDWLESELNEQGEPICWSVVMPTQRALAERFIVGEMTERELYEMTDVADSYDAWYIASIITVPQYQHRGLATRVLARVLERIPKNAFLFAWPTTEEGKQFLEKFTVRSKVHISMRK